MSAILPRRPTPAICSVPDCRRKVARDSARCDDHLRVLVDRVIGSRIGEQRVEREARR